MPTDPLTRSDQNSTSFLRLKHQKNAQTQATFMDIFSDRPTMVVCLAPGVVYGAATQWPQMLPHLGMPYWISSLDGVGFAKIAAIMVMFFVGSRAALKLAASQVLDAGGAYQ